MAMVLINWVNVILECYIMSAISVFCFIPCITVIPIVILNNAHVCNSHRNATGNRVDYI